MSSREGRLDRLFSSLNARERVKLMLADYKAGEAQDRTLLTFAPPDQTNELNRLIGTMNAANGDLAHLVLIIAERIKQEELRYYWLETMRIAALEMWAMRAAFAMSGREPITESEYRKREVEERAEMIPIDECAMLYTEYHHAWDDADYDLDDEGNQQPTDEAWYRVRDAKLAEMREAIAAGVLRATGKGKRMKIECGSFFDWIGAPVLVPPDIGLEYDVRPDHQWREVERERKDQVFIRDVLDRSACKLELPLDMESPFALEDRVKGFDEYTARLVAARLRTAVQENWRELRAIEEKFEAFSAEFDGDDVLHPTVRVRFDEAKALLKELHQKVQTYTGPFDLPDPVEEIRKAIETIAEQEIRHVPTR